MSIETLFSPDSLDLTVERKMRTDVATATNIINHSIELAHKTPNNDFGAKLEKLQSCMLRLHLTAVVASRQVEDFLTEVPAARTFVDELNETARALVDEASFESGEVQVVQNIAIAADLSHDKDLLRDLAEVLEMSHNEHTEMQRRACQIALAEDEYYINAYRRLKAGRLAAAPHFDGPSSNDSPVVETIAPVVNSPYDSPLNINSFDELFDGKKTAASTTVYTEYDLQYDEDAARKIQTELSRL